MRRKIQSKSIIIFSLYLLSITYPLAYYDVAFDNLALSSLKWLMLLLNVCVLALLIEKNSKGYKYSSLDLSVGALVIALVLMNIMFSSNKITSVATVIVLIISYMFFVLLSKAINNEIITMFEINKIIYKSIFIVVLFSFIATSEEYTYFMDVLTGDGRYRIKGLFRHPNSLAMNCFLGTIVLFNNLKIAKTKNIKTPIMNYIILVFFIFNILVSDSKTALFTLITFLIAYTFLNKIKDNFSYLKVLQLYSLLLLILFGVYKLFSLFANTGLNNDSNSVSVRLDSWVTVLSTISKDIERIVFGFGLSGTGGYVEGSQQNLGLAVDNSFVTLFYQTGLVGISLMFIVLATVSLKIFLKNELNLEKQNRVFTFSCLISLLLYSMFENLLLSMGNFVTLYIWFRIYNILYESKKLYKT